MPTHAYTHTHWRLVQYPLLAGYIQIGLDGYHLSPDHPLRSVINSYHARTSTHIHTHTHTHTQTSKLISYAQWHPTVSVLVEMSDKGQ